MKKNTDIQQLYELKQKGIISEKEYQALITNSGLSDNKPIQTEKLPFFVYFLHCITDKYSVFEGRARRKEFFGFFATYILLKLTLYAVLFILLDSVIIYQIINYLLYLYLFLPSICVSVRRLHDINFSGLWVLMPIFPLILFCIKSNKTANTYGDVPQGILKANKNLMNES